MTTLHIENQVQDFDTWKAVFDKFDRFRAEQGVRSYRMARGVTDRHLVLIDLDFDSVADAEAFSVALHKIWATPQSQEQMISHSEPVVLESVHEAPPN